MSWIRSAVNKAVEVGGKNTITRKVKTYAGTVAHHASQAVSGGAKIVQDRMGARNHKSFKQTVKNLEEAAVSCRGLGRIQLLRRWLLGLKEIERAAGSPHTDRSLDQDMASDESGPYPMGASMVFYFDSELGSEPMTFRDVFLHSQALEGIIMSMILEPPNEEEVTMLLEIFGLCLSGGKEQHNAILNSIKDLGKAFFSYEDEVLVKHEELLQFAQAAITGLKLSADIERIDAEASKVREKVDELEHVQVSPYKDHEDHEVRERKSAKESSAMLEVLKQALAEARLYSSLETLLLKKISINNGDTFETHSQKVDKLKVLAESLASSSTKAEKRITDHRQQKEEALNFRAAKDKEVSEVEKEISAEVSVLEKQRDELEAELKKVNISLYATNARLNKTKEERDKFDEASNQIVAHLNSKENDLSKSIASCKVEAGIVHTWLSFLENMWLMQSSYTEEKEKQTSVELEKYGKHFVKLTTNHLSACKEELGPAISQIRMLSDNIKNVNKRSELTISDSHLSKETNPLKILEEEYLEAEAKIITVFSVIDNMSELFYVGAANTPRGGCAEVDEIFDEIEKMREAFESIERPILSVDASPEKEATVAEESLKETSTHSAEIFNSKSKNLETAAPVSSKTRHLDQEAQLGKGKPEQGKITNDYLDEEIEGWEFDELQDN